MATRERVIEAAQKIVDEARAILDATVGRLDISGLPLTEPVMAPPFEDSVSSFEGAATKIKGLYRIADSIKKFGVERISSEKHVGEFAVFDLQEALAKVERQLSPNS